MKLLAIVFPGRRYSSDRSLLYFPSKVMEAKGFEMKYLHYNFEKEVEDNRPIDQAIEESDAYAQKALAGIDFKSYDHIVFLGKSIGTAVSGRIRKELAIDNVIEIYITPLPQTVPYFQRQDLIIVGDQDLYFPDPNPILTNYPNNYVFPSSTHSLENKKNYHRSIRVIDDVTSIVDRYLTVTLKLPEEADIQTK